MAKTRIINIKGSNGTVYVYEDVAYWDKEKGYATHKRKCIGKLGPDGEIVYNEGYNARKELEELKSARQKDDAPKEVPGEESIGVSRTTLAGQRMVMEKVASDLKLPKVLKSAFGKELADRILALAYYLVCSTEALSNSEEWLSDRGFSDLGITSQRISEMLKDISSDKQNSFFGSWIETHARTEAVLFDISSVSSYGRDITALEWGYNRDGEHLEQVNIALLTTRGANIPVWFSLLPGSMADVAVMDNTVETLTKLGFTHVPWIQDRGFYSKANLSRLTSRGIKFMIPIPSGVNESKELIAGNKDGMVSPENVIEIDEGHIIYGKTVHRMTEHGRTWFHIYYDPMRKEQSTANLMLKLQKCMDELKEEKPIKGHQALYDRYFITSKTPKKGLRVEYNHQAIQDYLNGEACYWVLETTFEKDVRKAYFTYRDRNDDELHFDDMKNTMDLKRLRCHSDAAVRGKVFIHFIALAILSRLRKTVLAIEPKKRHYWSEGEMLNKVSSYTKVHFHGKYKDVYSTPTKAQREIFDMLGIPYYKDGSLIKPGDAVETNASDSLGEDEIKASAEESEQA